MNAIINTRDSGYEVCQLSKQKCISLYYHNTLGKRVAEALPKFAMSSQREITVSDAPPEVVERFIKVANAYKQDDKIMSTVIQSRIFGVAGLFIAIRPKEETPNFKDADIVLNYNNIRDYDIGFNVLDIQALSGSLFLQADPTNLSFLQLKALIGSKSYNDRRITCIYPNEPLYLPPQTTEYIPYAPPSIYENMHEILDGYQRAIEGLLLLIQKAGVPVFIYDKMPDNTKKQALDTWVLEQSTAIINNIRNGQTLAIPSGSQLTSFDISVISGLVQALQEIKSSIVSALNDTPEAILFDKDLSHGLNEGSEDMKAVIMSIKNFRRDQLTPLYTLTDPIIQMLAWDDDFIEELKENTENQAYFVGLTNTEIKEKWHKSFKYEFGNLYPEPESTQVDIKGRKLDNLLKIFSLGGNLADIEAELKEQQITKNDIQLIKENTQQEKNKEQEQDQDQIKVDSDVLRLSNEDYD